MAGERVLTVASGHPEMNAGGSETAAYALFEAYRDAEGVDASCFVGCHTPARLPTGRLFPLRQDEYLWEQSVSDWFTMSTAQTDSLFHQFADLLRAYAPTIVHLHHYVHVGLDTIKLIRSLRPTARIVLTLHEYLALCFNEGQMIKTGSQSLCSREGLEACHACFPNKTPEDFWLRKERYLRHFAMVDAFVAPSEFLRRRYIDWGLAADRISVIENAVVRPDQRKPERDRQRNRFGFFGQVTPYKGVDTLLKGLAGLSSERRRDIRLVINGANLDRQPEAFQKRLRDLSDPLEVEGCLTWAGPYAPEMKAQRFRSVDWVVVPSIWWENSPMVIQEAFANRRPVLCSAIGGMAEKVRDGVDGRHVDPRSPAAWTEILDELCGDNDSWASLRAGITPRLLPADCAARHLALVRDGGTAAIDGGVA